MQLISCHAGQLQTLSTATLSSAVNHTKAFRTGMTELDALPPGQAFTRGAVHELLMPPIFGRPMFPAMLLARAAAMREEGSRHVEPEALGTKGKDRESLRLPLRAFVPDAFVPFSPIICCDPAGTLYPPALAAMGIPLDQLYLLHPKTVADQTWAIAECLRCPGVAAVVAGASILSRVQVRRLQLAVEAGGGVGILMRPAGNASREYAAATRWLVTPAPGERTVQRWKMQLIHGHGGLIGQSVFLEYRRDNHQTNSVRAIEQLADRPDEAREIKMARTA